MAQGEAGRVRNASILIMRLMLKMVVINDLKVKIRSLAQIESMSVTWYKTQQFIKTVLVNLAESPKSPIVALWGVSSETARWPKTFKWPIVALWGVLPETAGLPKPVILPPYLLFRKGAFYHHIYYNDQW